MYEINPVATLSQTSVSQTWCQCHWLTHSQ
jgi:hypothetical protein